METTKSYIATIRRPYISVIAERIFLRSVAIFRETRNGVRPVSGAKNQATAMAFGSPRSSCVRPGAHSARWPAGPDLPQGLATCRMALHVISAGAHAPHSEETLGPTATRGSSHSARCLRSLTFLCSSNDIASASVKRSTLLRFYISNQNVIDKHISGWLMIRTNMLPIKLYFYGILFILF